MIVSGSEQFDMIARKALPPGSYKTLDFKRSASAAKRQLLEKNYDIVLINAPLPDEMGHEFALDIAERYDSGILIALPPEIYGDVSDYVSGQGILTLPKVLDAAQLKRAVQFIGAVQEKIYRYEQRVMSVEEKMNEIRIVSKAKVLLVEKKHMTEENAHQYIGKMAMDHGVSRKKIAEQILEEWE